MGRIVGQYVYNGAGDRLAQEVNGRRTEYLLDASHPLTEVVGEFGAGNPTYYLLGLDVIGSQTGEDWSYFGYDGLGSTRFMLNAERTMTYAANYDPYGQVMAQYLPDATPSFGFTGQMTDASGLQYLRARYYNPSTGTFLSQDPKIGAYPQLSASWNGYNYAHGNPTTFIDPSGEIPLLFAAAVFVGGTIIGGVSYGAWDVSVEQGIGLGGHNQFNFGAINWGQAGGAFRTGANTGMAVSSFFTGLRTSYTAARMGAGVGRYLASHTALDFGLGVAGDMVINGDSVGEAALWNAAGFVGGEVVGAGVALADRGVRAGVRKARRGLGSIGRGTGDVASARHVGCSFTPDTFVSTDEGLVAISGVEQGDEVYAYNEETGEVDLYKVVAVWSHEDDNVLNLIVDGELIITTTDHPFRTDEAVWIEAGELEVGDVVVSADGDYGVVESVQAVIESRTMYNLTVDEAHTYFVGEGRWLVHNDCDIDLSGFGLFKDRDGTSIVNNANIKNINAADADLLIFSRFVREQAGNLEGYPGFIARVSTFGAGIDINGKRFLTVNNAGPGRTGALMSSFGVEEAVSKRLVIPEYGDVLLINPLHLDDLPRWFKKGNLTSLESGPFNRHAEGNLIGFIGGDNIKSIGISHPGGMCDRCNLMISQLYPDLPVYYSTWKRKK